MKIPVIKKLVKEYSLEDLQQAENDIADELTPKIVIEGEDEGEQLTHAHAAVWILEQMNQNNTTFEKELRNFTQRVRNSIS